MVTARKTGRKAAAGAGAARKASKSADKRSKGNAAKTVGKSVRPARTGKAAKGDKSSKDDDGSDGPSRSNPLGLEVDAEVLEFIEALDRFKKQHNRPFPSWSEVLHVLRELGYRRG